MEVHVGGGQQPVVVPEGEIDLSTVGGLEEALGTALRGSPAGVVVDLSGVRYMDSSGISVLLSAYHRLRAYGGALALVVPEGSLRDLLDLVHLDQIPGLHLCGDRETARNSLAAGASDDGPAPPSP